MCARPAPSSPSRRRSWRTASRRERASPSASRPSGTCATRVPCPRRSACSTAASVSVSPRRSWRASTLPRARLVLDVPATLEVLESLSVPVLGFRTDELPLFYSAGGGPAVSARVVSAEEAAAVARAHWERGGGGLLLARPPDESLDDIEPLIEHSLRDAKERGVSGKDVTPLVLSFLHERSGGRTLAANRAL